MSTTTLRDNLLTYIAYCLRDKSFSYIKCRKDLESAGITTTLASLRKEFSLCKKEGLVNFKTHYRRPYPIVTLKGRLAIKTRLAAKHYGEFDSWKMIIFDIPENWRNKRLILQNELINLGFGKIARGVYLSPRPLFTAVKRIAKKLGIEENLTFLKTVNLEDEKRVIYRAWNLKDLNGKYENFIQRAKVATFERKSFWPLYAKRLEKEFASIYEKDPHLPEKFLPANWLGAQAYGIFKAISNSY